MERRAASPCSSTRDAVILRALGSGLSQSILTAGVVGTRGALITDGLSAEPQMAQPTVTTSKPMLTPVITDSHWRSVGPERSDRDSSLALFTGSVIDVPATPSAALYFP